MKFLQKLKIVQYLSLVSFIFLGTVPLACKDAFSIKCEPFLNIGIESTKIEKLFAKRKQKVSAIILHSTNWNNKKKYLELSIKEGMLVHLLIDRKGKLYGVQNPQDYLFHAAPTMDESAIHIALEGTPGKILKTKKQLKTALNLIKRIATAFNIPLSNYDISSKSGIFTHTQSKIKFGGFIKIYPEDGGEKVIKYLLNKLKGRYYPEHKWKDRYTKNWVYRKENKSFISSRGKYAFGRGITPVPKTVLNIVEKDKDKDKFLPKNFRIKYIDRGLINPTCITLHFSGSRSFYSTRKDLEKRRLASTFIGGPKGKIYQVMDKLEHKAAAATGTNKYCMQIEIVGRSEKELLRNKRQLKKVALLLKELSQRFNFPLNNLDIDSHRGVFSHGQAKKRYGQSVWIMGDDFDPGENYMKKVIEQSGGTYYPEKKWKDRKSLKWKILYRKFQP